MATRFFRIAVALTLLVFPYVLPGQATTNSMDAVERLWQQAPSMDFRLNTISLRSEAASLSVSLSPNVLHFGFQKIGTTSQAQQITVRNTGTATLFISTIGISGTHPDDFVQSHTCGTSLKANVSCYIYVRYRPTLNGTVTAYLFMQDGVGRQSVLLVGDYGGRCVPKGQQCLPWAPCCPGLVCIPASTRAFCE